MESSAFNSWLDTLSSEKRALLALRALKSQESAVKNRQATIRRHTRADGLSVFPLSFAQERLWFLDQLEPGSVAYSIPGVMRINGTLQVEVLERAVNEIVKRHEVLRTRFENRGGAPVQVIRPEGVLKLETVNLEGMSEDEQGRRIEELAKEEGGRSFDLARGPLLRMRLARLAQGEHVLFFTMHHIVSDGWSMGVLIREFGQLYEAFSQGRPSPLVELPIQYVDYAVWQRGWLQGEVLAKQLRYWKERLQDAPVLELPTDRPRPAVQSYDGASERLVLSKELLDDLNKLSRGEEVTLFMTLSAAFKVLLSRYSGQEDIVVGTPIANRTRVETEGLIGFFVNTLALRTDLSGDPTFKELLKREREAALGAYGHQDVPFEKVVAELQMERALSRSPLFQVMLNMLNLGDQTLSLPGLDVEQMEAYLIQSKFDLTLYVTEQKEGLKLETVYNKDLFNKERISEMLEQLELVLGQMVSLPERRINDFSLTTRRMKEWAPQLAVKLEFRWDVAVHRLFEQQAKRFPKAVAICEAQDCWSYEELDSKSNRLANYLRAQGVGPGYRVAIYGNRSANLVLALLGILKAGGSFMILDPSYPGSRLKEYVQLAKPRGWLHWGVGGEIGLELKEFVSSIGKSFGLELPLDWHRSGDSCQTYSSDSPNLGIGPDQEAYIAFTSGSAGKPKGIIGTHLPLAHFVKWQGQEFALSKEDRFSLLSGLSHDPLLRDIFTPLSLGAQLCIPKEPYLESENLTAWVKEQKISVMHLTPALGQVLCLYAERNHQPFELPSLRYAFFGGDVLTDDVVKGFSNLAPLVQCVNFYGTTETPQAVGYYRVGNPAGWQSNRLRRIPIGTGIEGVNLVIINKSKQLTGIGEIGEIWVRSPYLSRGYLEDLALNQERFQENWFSNCKEDRMYRTGDLGRYLPDGNIGFWGRKDHQVKIRGLRIELGEIEAALEQHCGVQQTVVVVREDEPGEKQLVGYVVEKEEGSATSSELRRYLKTRLPEYMVPAFIVMLEKLPLTPNGKIDRKALPMPEGGSAKEYVAPRNGVEELLAGVFQRVLRVDRVGVHDNFFELGGHSLLATQLVSRIRELFEVEMPLRSLFESPTVYGLSRKVEEAQRSGVELVAPPLRRMEKKGDLPLSYAQERLWFIDQLQPDSVGYNMPGVVRIRGVLQVEVLERAINEIIRRHEVLRTTFNTSATGQAVQIIHEVQWRELRMVDLAGLGEAERMEAAGRLIDEEAERPFNLNRGPVVRASVLRLGAEDHVILYTLHHIASDGWSMGVLNRELETLYEAFAQGRPSPLTELSVQYADFAVWQRRWLRGEALAKQLEYWREQLEGISPLQLPTDRPRPVMQTFNGAVQAIRVSPELAGGLKELSKREGITLFMTLLAGFQFLLSRYSGQKDIAVGTPIANRNIAEIEGLIGFFVNTLVMRTNLKGDLTVKELLQRVKEVGLGAYGHQDLPFEKLVEELQPERNLSRNPLVQVVLALQNAPDEGLELKGMVLEPVNRRQMTTRFDLEAHFRETRQGLTGWVVYNTDLFDGITIERMVGHWGRLLEEIVRDPLQRISELEMLSPQERYQLLMEWNDTRTDYPKEKCIHELFEEQAEQTPDNVAVVFEDKQLSYRELNERSNQLANYLRKLGVGPEVLVGICVERSLEMVIGLLGILKAGGAYVPLDANYPAERLRYMLGDAQVEVLMTQEKWLGLFSGYEGLTVYMERDKEAIGRQEAGNVPAMVGAENLAYVIYTSGSTGQPKGCMVQHQGLVNVCRAQIQRFGVSPKSQILQFASLNFDASMFEIAMAFAAGGALHVAKVETLMPGTNLLGFLKQNRITHAVLPPSALAVLPWEQLSDLGVICVAGEACGIELVKKWGAGRRFYNLYGPTEGSIWTTATLPLDQNFRITIGRPISNTSLYILDNELRPVPVGITGEMYIGGDGLARGYVNHAELTAEKFIPNPFGKELGERMYRTGDLGRYLPGGNIEFLGRMDHQVKIRGYRIELGEIEAVLNGHCAVGQSVVVAREDELGDKRLVGYVVIDPDTAREMISAELKGAQVREWETVFDDTYNQSPKPADSRFNIVGWNSSYTGEPIPAEEMGEWLEEALDDVRRLDPKRVLEIGCGTGMILFGLADRCAEYWATDFSRGALAYIERQMEGAGLERSRIHLLQHNADNFDGISDEKFDCVILNSVVQYFPDVEYLVRVLEGAEKTVGDGGFIFLGDIRSFPLQEAFHTSVELYKATETLGLKELRERIQLQMRRENELLVDPVFFFALQRRLPRIRHVEIRPKGTRTCNELTQFRYQVILHIGVDPELVEVAQWLDAEKEKRTLEDLRQLLQVGQPNEMGMRGIANKLLQREVLAVSHLRNKGAAQVGELREELRREPADGVAPWELYELGRELAYNVEISWARHGTEGRFDAVFWRAPAKSQLASSGKARARFWDDKIADRPMREYANNPLHNELTLQLIPQLRSYLLGKLPEYMVPSFIVMLESLPLTPNGKVDWKALPAPEGRRSEKTYIAPRTPTEEMVAGIYQAVLKVEQVGIHDNFFELGGHSLLATRLVSRVREVFLVEMPLRSLFEAPTVAGISEKVEAARQSGVGLMASPLRRVERKGDLPLSFAQERLWFLYLIYPEFPFNMRLVFRIEGNFNLGLLRESFYSILKRHEMLRTSFRVVDGLPRQVITPDLALEIPLVELSNVPSADKEARRLIEEDVCQPFDLAECPLFRVKVFHLGHEHHIFMLVMHHILADGWSIGVLVREFEELYEAFSNGQPSPLPGLPIQYADFAVWQRDWLQGKYMAPQLEYWKGKLGGDLPILELPTNRPRLPVPSRRGAIERFTIDKKISDKLKRLSQQNGVTLFMTLLTAFDALLYRYTSQEDIFVGTHFANRNRTETEGLIGFFINRLLLRSNLSGDPIFDELLQQTREVTLQAYMNGDIPFERVAAEIKHKGDLNRTSLFQVMIVLENELEQLPTLSGLKVSAIEFEQVLADVDIYLSFSETSGGLQGSLQYNTDIFDRSRIISITKHLLAILNSVISNPRQRVSDLEILSKEERQQLLEEWNDTRVDYPKDKCIHELFEEQAERTPENVAVVYEDKQLTYRELNERSNQLAHYLRKLGVEPEVLVGICVERSLEMIVGLLGILKAGGAYVPLDPQYPKERLAFMLEDARVKVVLTQERFRDRVGRDVKEIVCLESWMAGDERKTNLEKVVWAKNMAYMIYTSGSTGYPKGAINTHEGIRNRLQWMQDVYRLGVEDRVVQKTPYTFDVSVWEFFWPLMSGSRLVMAQPEGHKDVTYLIQLIERERITTVHFVPSMLQVFLEEVSPGMCSELKRVICSGESLPHELVRRFFERLPGQLHNLYGPTEASVDVTYWACPRHMEGEVVPIGKPIANMEVYILDEHLNPVPEGVMGEIYLGGVGLGRGYFGRVELTGERFIPNPFGKELGERMYRTGDLGRYLSDGNIEFIGRKDHQVKVRGYRIELGEVESVLGQHPAVQQSIVIAREDESGNKQMVGYVTLKEGRSVMINELREYLKGKLPEYMVPPFIVVLDKLPLTPNGKVDRKALPAPDRRQEEGTFIAPQTPSEELLVEIYQAVLKVERVGIHDNFFGLGGHSLLATQLVSRVREVFKVELPLRTLFENPTIVGLSGFIMWAAKEKIVATSATDPHEEEGII